MDILENKQTKTYDYFSRYNGINFYYNKEDGKYMYGLSKQLDDNTPYIIHKVQQGDSFDSLAEKYYGRPDYF